MLTMMCEFTVKKVDQHIIECDSIRSAGQDALLFYLLPTMHCYHSNRLPAGSEVQKEWLMYKENVKTTVEQCKVCISILELFQPIKQFYTRCKNVVV